MPSKHKLAGMQMECGYWMVRDENAQGIWMWVLQPLKYLMSQMTHTVVI